MRPLAFLVLVVLGSFPVLPVAHPCTIRGTDERDFLKGTPHDDVICGLGGRDFIAGEEGDDRLRGDGGRDTIVGGEGRDVIRGQRGPDHLFAVDGKPRDLIRGGKGFDRCYGEKGDVFRSCEVIHTNGSPHYPLEVVMALSAALEATVGAAEAELALPPCGPENPGCGTNQ